MKYNHSKKVHANFSPISSGENAFCIYSLYYINDLENLVCNLYKLILNSITSSNIAPSNINNKNKY